MTRENLAYLVGGLAFGALLGYGVFHIAERPPAPPPAAASTPSVPSGSPSRSAGGAAPADASMPMEEVENLKRVLEADPRNVTALVRLANLFQDAGMWDKAVAHYDQALAVRPDDPDVLTDAGICFRELRQFDRALDYFKRAQQVDPNHWKSLFNIVIVAGFDLRRMDEADQALKRLEQVNPSAPNLQQVRQDLDRVRAERKTS